MGQKGVAVVECRAYDIDHSGLYELLISQRLSTFLKEGTKQHFPKKRMFSVIGQGLSSPGRTRRFGSFLQQCHKPLSG